MSREAITKIKTVAVIGATGSVGTSVLDVCRDNRDSIRVVALAAHSNYEKLAQLAMEFGSEIICLDNSDTASKADSLVKGLKILQGSSGLKEIAEWQGIDHIVFASSGTSAIHALQAALRAGKEVSLANKESIVVGGPWVMPLVQYKDQLRPLDSEHNAIWQCLQGESEHKDIRRVYLTASGGPFRTFSKENLESVTPEMALNHPVWAMGAKITIDSATLMNKGIELLEAMYLFGLEPHQLDAVISPGSFVHGIVEFNDGFVKMLAGEPDMRLPAASCLMWPMRPVSSMSASPTHINGRTISFEAPDEDRFPALTLAKEAMRKKGAYPALLVGADEVAVERFLKKQISFNDIPKIIDKVLSSYTSGAPNSLEEAISLVDWAKKQAGSATLHP